MILIAGLGYIGEALADRLHASGEPVAGLTKSRNSAAALGKAKPYPVHACDISDPEALLKLRSEIKIPDSLVHCASSGRGAEETYRAVYLEGGRNLLDTFPGTPLLFTSSTGVYAQDDGSTITEDSPAEPDRETGRILLETENLVLSRGGTIARLAGIYGPGRSIYLKRFFTGEARIEGDGGRFLNQVHRADIVSALIALLNSPNAPGHIFNVVDDTPMSQAACYAFLANHFDKPIPPTGPHDPDRKRGSTNKRVSNTKLRSLGWSPDYPSFQDAVLNDSVLVRSIEAQI